jgi:hypothetical protein
MGDPVGQAPVPSVKIYFVFLLKNQGILQSRKNEFVPIIIRHNFNAALVSGTLSIRPG